MTKFSPQTVADSSRRGRPCRSLAHIIAATLLIAILLRVHRCARSVGGRHGTVAVWQTNRRSIIVTERRRSRINGELLEELVLRRFVGHRRGVQVGHTVGDLAKQLAHLAEGSGSLSN